ncbi:MAG: YdiU family protein [Thermodesulfobacteriota bacterium]
MRKITELNFNNSYRSLPEEFYDLVVPTPFTNPHLVNFNPDAGELIDLDPNEARSEVFSHYFSGKKQIPGSDPIAMYYTGHQFGVYNKDIGDGRAILLGQVTNSKAESWDLHLKGSGRTKYSRVFDGRAVLRSCIREYLCSEAMHTLGIPTTRALCIIGSDEKVERETTEMGAMMVRMAQTHVRFGSFEAFHYLGDQENVKILADYVIEHQFPEFINLDERYHLFFSEVVRRTAELIAKWQSVGFTHGVMNTDNMSITGLTIDYGPYGFIENYDPEYIPNHSDHFGRYSYQNQPAIAHWNLTKLALALSSILADESANESLDNFRNIYSESFIQIMRTKLGLKDPLAEDAELIKGILEILAGEDVDYTNFFRRLSDIESHDITSNFSDKSAITGWLSSYQKRLSQENTANLERKKNMDLVNPKFILRNYLAENAIRKAVDNGDYAEVERLHMILKNPFSEQIQFQDYSDPSPDWGKNLVISCSS